MSYVTDRRFDRIVNVPAALPETELRRGKSIQIAQWRLELGQRLVLKNLCVHVVRILTPGVLPVYANTALGTASAGLYLDGALTSPIALARTSVVGAVSTYPYAAHVAVTPGLYTVVVSNNTTNVDLAVCASGVFRVFS